MQNAKNIGFFLLILSLLLSATRSFGLSCEVTAPSNGPTSATSASLFTDACHDENTPIDEDDVQNCHFACHISNFTLPIVVEPLTLHENASVEVNDKSTFPGIVLSQDGPPPKIS